jgi:hypothetical protein
VTTSIILPSVAGTVWIAEPGVRIPEPFVIPTQPFNKTVKLGSTIGLAAGRGAVAIRIFAADVSSQSGSDEAISSGGNAPLFLAGDDRGMPLGAIRLVAYHYRGHYTPPDPTTAAGKSDTHLRFGALIKAAAVPLPSAKETGAALHADAVAGLVQSLVAAEITSKTETDQSGSALWRVSTIVDPTEPVLGVNTSARSAAEIEGKLKYTALTTVPEKVELAVDRNLTCSESSTADKNQSSAKHRISLLASSFSI